MKDILEKTTKEQYIHDLADLLPDKTWVLFLAKTQFTYPEYVQRIKTSRVNALNEARVNKYSDTYTKAFILHRIDMEVRGIYQDMRSAYEILSAKIKFKKPDILASEPFLKLEKQLKFEPIFEVER